MLFILYKFSPSIVDDDNNEEYDDEDDDEDDDEEDDEYNGKELTVKSVIFFSSIDFTEIFRRLLRYIELF